MYNNNFIIFKKVRFTSFSITIWRLLYFLKLNNLNKFRNKKIRSRGSTLPFFLVKNCIYIYNGKIWKKRFISFWKIGFKLGEFSKTRKIALFKAKQLKKKKK